MKIFIVLVFVLVASAWGYYKWINYQGNQRAIKVLENMSTTPYKFEMQYKFVLDGAYSLDLLAKKDLKYGVDFWTKSTDPKINMLIDVYQDGSFIHKHNISDVFGHVMYGRKSYQKGWVIWRFNSPNDAPKGEVVFKITIIELDENISKQFGPLAISIQKSYDK
jgi:hypothetical protein